jgi:hypothetical protein
MLSVPVSDMKHVGNPINVLVFKNLPHRFTLKNVPRLIHIQFDRSYFPLSNGVRIKVGTYINPNSEGKSVVARTLIEFLRSYGIKHRIDNTKLYLIY